MKIKHKLFLLDRKILCHPVLRYIYPQPGFARRLVAGMMAFVVLGTGLIVYYQPGKVDAAWYSDTWKFRKLITIDNAMAPSTQTDFPVMINITDSGLATHAQSTGNDILFTSSDGSTKLSHEIEKYTDSTGQVIAWVKIPSLSSSADTNIYMYYGNASASDQQDAANVWDSNFSGVWHLKEDPTSTCTGTKEVCDSTSNNNDGDAFGSMTSGDQVAGKIDGSLDFDGSDDDIGVTHNENLNFANRAAHTISFWINSGANNGTYEGVLKKYGTGREGWSIFRDFNTNIIIMERRAAGGTFISDCALTFTPGEWTHMVFRYDGTNLTCYKNTSLTDGGEDDTPNMGTTTTDMEMAAGMSGNWDGKLDEVRISATSRSVDWITTEYNNQNSPSTYVNVGSKQEQKGAPVLYWNFDGGNGTSVGDSGSHNNGGVGGNATPQDGGACLFGGKCLKFTNNGGSSVFSDGFESGGTSNWTGVDAGISASTERPLDGNYSAKITMTGTGQLAWKDITAQTAAYMRGYVYVSSASTEFEIMSLYSTTGNHGFILYRDGDGDLCIWNGNIGSGTCSSSVKVPLGEWHKYELYATISASAGKLRAYVDGAVVADLDLSGQNTGTSSINRAQMGEGNNGRTATWYIDEYSVDTAPFTYVKRSYKSDTELDPGTGSFTASAWFKHPSSVSGTDTLIARSNGAVNGIGYKIYMNSSGNVCFGIDDDATSFPDDDACSTSTYTDSYWHHVQAVKDGTSSITLYIDGKQVDQDGTLAATATLSGSSPAFYVGIDGDGTSNPWDGFIDEVKYFDYAKTPAQVKADYNAKGSVLGASVVFGAGDAANSVNQGLVGYWKMDDGVGNLCSSGVNYACDSSGNGNNGTWTGDTASTSGKFGFATTYDGTGDYVNVPDATALNMTDKITISAWIKPDAVSGSYAVMNKYSGNCPDNWSLLIDAGEIKFSQKRLASCTFDGSVSAPVSAGNWYHVVAVHDGSKNHLYLNGQLIENTAITEAMITTSDPVRFGARSGGTPLAFDGIIDEARIYNRALSDREVRSLYDWAPGPVGHWKMDERTGTSANDSSGNGNAGTLTNGPTWNTGKYGGAVNFDGSNDYATIPSNTANNITGDITVSAWVKLNSLPSAFKSAVFKGSSGTRQYGLGVTSSNIWRGTFGDSGGETGVDSGVTATTDWTYLTVVKSGTTAQVYVNGVKSGSSQTVDTLNSTASELTIGRLGATSGEYFNGIIDDVRIYNYARTSKQIVQDMNGGHPAVGSPIGSALAHWNFDEGWGTTASNSGSLGATAHGGVTSMSTPPSTFSGWTNHGRYGKALLFDGVNDFVNINGVTSSIATGDVTFSTWFRFNTTFSSSSPAIQSLMALSTSPSTNDVQLRFNNANGALEFRVNPGGTSVSAVSRRTSWASQEWHHVVGTYSSTHGMRLYVDGKLEGIHGNTSRGSTAATAAWIGKRHDGQQFSGAMDEVKIYNYALSVDDVRTEYNQGKAVVLGALSTAPDGSATNSAARYYCPPGDSDGNCAAGSDPSPVGYWKLDERTGTSANDSSGNGLIGTLTNSPLWTAGKVGSGIKFGGVSDQNVVVSDSSLFSPSGDFTVSFWLKLGRLASQMGADQMFVYKDHSVSPWYSYQIYQQSSDNKIAANWSNSSAGGGPTYGSTALATNTWYYVTYMRTGTTGKIYINGIDDTLSSNTLSGTTLDSNGSLYIGGITAKPSDSVIDDLRIYSYVRSQAQLAWDYNRGRPTSWWKFDECTGSTMYDTAWTASGSASRVNGAWSGSGGTNTSVGNCTDSGSTARYSGRTGKFNSSLDFDGADDSVAIINNALIDLNEGLRNGFTISAWVNADTAGESDQGHIFTKDDSKSFCRTKNPVGSHLDLECSLDLGTDATITVGNAFDTGGWHNVVMSWTDDSDDEISVWIDGKLRGTSNNGIGPTISENNVLYIGNNSQGTATFDGRIDQVMIFPYQLTSPMIKVLYNENSAVRIGPASGRP